MPWILLHQTWQIYWQIYPCQLSTDALNTATPNLADLPQITSTYERPFTHEGNYLVFNCCHFATESLHAVKMLICYCHHFQLLSLCNWPSLCSYNAHFLSSSFFIVITLQLIFRSISSLQYTIFRCQGYIFSAVKLSQFLQYLPKYVL